MITPEQAVERAPVDDVVLQHEAAVPQPSDVVWWIGGGAALVLTVGWLAIRPASPQGAAAVVDLLVLPAVLFAEARLLAGRPTISAALLSIFFGLGAVFSSLAALLLEWPAARVLSPSAMDAFGPVVEVMAPCAPVVIVAALLLRLDRRPTVADLALGGVASGLGFLVVTTSLLAATSHRAPDYATPLVAGWQRVQLPGGGASMSFVGAGVGTALVGLGLGIAIRWPTRPWRIAPLLLAACLLVLDRSVYDRFLREAVTGDVAPPSRLSDIVRQLTFSGRIELVVLVLGLVLLGRRLAPSIAGAGIRHRRRSPAATGHEGEPGAQPEEGPDDHADRAGRSDQPGPLPATGGDDPAAVGLHAAAAAIAIAAGAATLFVVLARTRHLGFLQDRPVAMAVSTGAFGYALLRLAALRCPAEAPPVEGEQVDVDVDVAGGAEQEDLGHDALEETTIPPDDGRQVLCLAAMAASALGMVLSLLPSPMAVPPLHRTLVLDAVEGWGAQVGHLGLLLGMCGLAAPPGPVMPQTPAGWRDLLPWRIRSSTWWRGLAPRRGWWRRGGFEWLRSAGDAERLAHRRLRLSWRWRADDFEHSLEELVAVEERAITTTITVEPVDESARERIEFEGSSVQEAMEAAVHHIAPAAGRTSLQLVDEGLPPKPGRPGSGRPARVRVMRARSDDDRLLPPARDSIVRTSPMHVVVEIVDEHEAAAPSTSEGAEVLSALGAGPPARIDLVITGPSHSESRILTCSREKASPGRARYRSNPYSVDTGEDAAWVAPPATAAKGISIGDGEQLRVEAGDQVTWVTLYDGWARQVNGVNHALFDIADAHHANALAALDHVTETASEEIERLRSCLVAVEHGRRLLASPADDEEKAFLGTALLHQAMSLDPTGSDTVMEAAITALEEHRRAASDDPSQGETTRVFRRLLASTVVGRLWAAGATSPSEIDHLVGWSDPSGAEEDH